MRLFTAASDRVGGRTVPWLSSCSLIIMFLTMSNSTRGQTSGLSGSAGDTTVKQSNQEGGGHDLLPRHLRAGPITLKFQDGQLRYLRVGEKEMIRRIYFGV